MISESFTAWATITRPDGRSMESTRGRRRPQVRRRPARYFGSGEPPSNPRLRAEDVAGDDHALDLAGPLVDLEQLGVAHQLLDGVVLGVAVAAEDLDRVGRRLHGRVGAVGLGVAGDDAVGL